MYHSISYFLSLVLVVNAGSGHFGWREDLKDNPWEKTWSICWRSPRKQLKWASLFEEVHCPLLFI